MDRLNGDGVDLAGSVVGLEEYRLRVPSSVVTDPRYVLMFEPDGSMDKRGLFFRFNNIYALRDDMRGMAAAMKGDSDAALIALRNDNRLTAEQIVELERIIATMAGCSVNCGYGSTTVAVVSLLFSLGIPLGIAGLFSQSGVSQMVLGGSGAVMILFGVGILAVRALSRCWAHPRVGELPLDGVLPNDFPSGFHRVALRLDFPGERIIGVFSRGDTTVIVDINMLRDVWTQFIRNVEAIFDSDTGVPIFDRLCELLMWESALTTEGKMVEHCKAYVRWKLPQLPGLTDDQRRLLVIYINAMQGITSKQSRCMLCGFGGADIGMAVACAVFAACGGEFSRDFEIATGLLAATSLGWFIAAEIYRRKFNKFAAEARDLERWLIARGGAGGTRVSDLDSLSEASPYT
jgi:hypothetical protein